MPARLAIELKRGWIATGLLILAMVWIGLANNGSAGAQPPDAGQWVPAFTADFHDAKSLDQLWLPRWCEPKVDDGKLILPPPGRQGRVLDYYDGQRFPMSVRVEVDVAITTKANANALGLGINIDSDGYDSGTGYYFQFGSAGCLLRREAGSYNAKLQLGITDGGHLNQPVEGVANAQIRPEAGKVHHLVAERDGNHLSFSVDGVQAFAYDDAHAVPMDSDRGFIGLVSKNCTLTIEKFVVYTRAGQDGAIIKPVDPPQGIPITIKGVAGCSRSATTREDEGIHILQVYAYDGSGDIPDKFQKMMDQYFPADHGMNVQEAETFQQQFDKQLLYNITDCHLARTIHSEAHFQSKIVSLTGTFYEVDGKRWIYPTEIKEEMHSLGDLHRNPALGIVQFPAKMLEPDKPIPQPGKMPLTLKIDDTLSIKCILLPAGSFVQGSPYYQPYRWQDEHAHEVTLTKPFYFAEHPITQEVFEAVMQKNPSPAKGPQFPVQHVTLADIEKFCQIVSQKTGRTVRQPTDAEWEYTARVGTSGPCFTEKYMPQLSHAGDKAQNTSAAVMTKSPNAWGIYDMISGAWCVDSDYAANDSRVNTIDQTGPARDDPTVRDYGNGPVRKAKGGEYYDDWRPSMHGAVDDDGNGAEGNTVFTVVVEATAQEIAGMGDGGKK